MKSGWLIAGSVVLAIVVLAQTYYHQRTGISFLPDQDAKANAIRDIQAELDLALRKQADQVVEDIRKNGLTQAAQTIERELTPAQQAYINAQLALNANFAPPATAPVEPAKAVYSPDLPRLFQPVITEDFSTSANSFGVR